MSLSSVDREGDRMTTLCGVCDGTGTLGQLNKLMSTLLSHPGSPRTTCPACNGRGWMVDSDMVARGAEALYRQSEEVFGDSIQTWDELPDSELTYWHELAEACILAALTDNP